jgi:hypothetical protein
MAQKQQFEKIYEDGWDDSPAGDAEGSGAREPRSAPLSKVAPLALAAVPTSAPALTVAPSLNVAAPAPAAQTASVPPPQGQQLAPWPARDRAGLYPALFSRSALFQVGRGKRLKGGEAPAPAPRAVACQGGHELSATGPRLSMRDKAVWEFALDRARAAGQIGVEFELSARACALALGASKDRSSETLRRVRESLDRLATTTLGYELSTGEKGSCKLLASSRRDGKACVVALDPKLGALLEADFLFKLDAPRRAGLGSDLAKWLHDFHSTHEQFDGAFSVETLRGLCGYEAQPGHFSGELQAAMRALAEAAPKLLAAFHVAKPSAKAGSWKASVTRGEEVVSYEMPEREWRKRGRRPNL